MVGQNVLREGKLDVKCPAKSSFARGWRLPPWKTRHVKLVEADGGITELHMYKENSQDLVDIYQLVDITDITMVASKTHAHAFEIVSRGSSMLVVSGLTELESREWIWALRKIFWPHVIPQIEANDRLDVQLIPNADSKSVGLVSGIYSIQVSIVAIEMTLVTRCDPGDRSSTPVETFNAKTAIEQTRLPLTMIGRLKIENVDGRMRLGVETIPDCDIGARTLLFERADETTTGQTIKDVVDVIKSALFQATNNLHDCIASSQWTMDTET